MWVKLMCLLVFYCFMIALMSWWNHSWKNILIIFIWLKKPMKGEKRLLLLQSSAFPVPSAHKSQIVLWFIINIYLTTFKHKGKINKKLKTFKMMLRTLEFCFLILIFITLSHHVSTTYVCVCKNRTYYFVRKKEDNKTKCADNRGGVF